MPVAIAAYPEFESQVRSLVLQHRRLKDGGLHLAVYFAPPRRGKRDVFLLEIIDGFGGDTVDPENKLFEFGYESTPGFPLPAGANLRMVLTSPTEFHHAVDNHWKAVEEPRAARGRSDDRDPRRYAGQAAVGTAQMTLPQAWMKQAESDFRTAERVDNQGDARTRCQAISKYQQCVEKSIKSVLDKLFAAGVIAQGSDRRHQVARYAAVLSGFPATRDNRALLNQLRRLFTERVLDQISFLDSLVPAYPAPGGLPRGITNTRFRMRRVSGVRRPTTTPSLFAR